MKPVTPVTRLAALLAVPIGLAMVVVACSDGSSESLETLPPIRTTTTVPTTVPTPTTRPETYEVQQGESLSDIAVKFGLNWIELADYNGIDNPDYVQAGDVLRIPPIRGEGGGQQGGESASG